MPPGGDNPLKVLLLLTLTTILSIREEFNPQGITTDDDRPMQKVRNSPPLDGISSCLAGMRVSLIKPRISLDTQKGSQDMVVPNNDLLDRPSATTLSWSGHPP
jgi:hypothetical protein